MPAAVVTGLALAHTLPNGTNQPSRTPSHKEVRGATGGTQAGAGGSKIAPLGGGGSNGAGCAMGLGAGAAVVGGGEGACSKKYSSPGLGLGSPGAT